MLEVTLISVRQMQRIDESLVSYRYAVKVGNEALRVGGFFEMLFAWQVIGAQQADDAHGHQMAGHGGIGAWLESSGMTGWTGKSDEGLV